MDYVYTDITFSFISIKNIRGLVETVRQELSEGGLHVTANKKPTPSVSQSKRTEYGQSLGTAFLLSNLG